MINSWKSYLSTGKIKKKTIDKEESAALFEKAKQRIAYSRDKEITRLKAQFVLEDAYEAMREAAQSLMSLSGYKPYSHEATIAFIKDNYNEFDEEEIYALDRFRRLRNDSVYKALPIMEEDAISAVQFALKMIDKINAIRKKKQ